VNLKYTCRMSVHAIKLSSRCWTNLSRVSGMILGREYICANDREAMLMKSPGVESSPSDSAGAQDM